MEQRNLVFPLSLALLISACQQPADDSNIAIDNGVNAAEAANAEIETLPPSETSAPAPANGVGEARVTPGAARVPLQYRGRWGMVAADCTSTRGDNKGLITIDEGTVKFYESVATLKEQRPAIATSFSGLYAFAGEGQTWEKVVTLTRTGSTLERADEEGSYTYTRCA